MVSILLAFSREQWLDLSRSDEARQHPTVSWFHTERKSPDRQMPGADMGSQIRASSQFSPIFSAVRDACLPASEDLAVPRAEVKAPTKHRASHLGTAPKHGIAARSGQRTAEGGQPQLDIGPFPA